MGAGVTPSAYILAWARGEALTPGDPHPRDVCAWLHDYARTAPEPQAYRAACNLVLIANGLRKAAPPPPGWTPSTPSDMAPDHRDVKPDNVLSEPLVQEAAQILQAELVGRR